MMRVSLSGMGWFSRRLQTRFNQPVAGYARPVFSKELRMFLDEGDDVVQLLLGRLETALAVGRDDEFVTAHTPAVAVCPDV